MENESVVAALGHNVHLDGGRGPVIRATDVQIPAGAFSLVSGPVGSGRTCLLLALSGRMNLSRGSELTVLGHALPREGRQVRALSAVANIKGVDELDETVTLRQTVAERLAWNAPAWRFVRKPSDARIRRLLAPVFADGETPAGDTLIHQLDPAELALTRIGLALLSGPELLLVDDLDDLHGPHRARVVACLHALADSGLTVVGAASEDSGLTAPHTITLTA